MDELYTDKIFEFSKILDNSNELFANIQVVQVGETCLDKSASVEEHVQRCPEITCVVSGKGILTCDDESVVCSAGDVQIISEGRRHSLTAVSDMSFRYIHFAFRFCDYEPKALSEFYNQCDNVVLHDNGEIRNILNMIVDEYFDGAEFTDIVRCNLINLLLILLWRKVNVTANKYEPVIVKEPISSIVYDITKYIDKHIPEIITVNSVAEQFSYSANYISRLFKAKMGISLKEYIVNARMGYAEVLLKEGKSSISEIARIVGYDSVQAFCKRFKKYSGKTPGDIRK